MEKITLTRDHINKPCVYIAYKDTAPVYIGVGTQGMARVFNIEKNERSTALSSASHIEIEYFDTPTNARDRETELIHQYHPTANRFCSQCSHYYKRNPRTLRVEGQLFGIVRHAVLSLLLGNPEKAYHCREIIRLCGSSSTRELPALAKTGILRRTESGSYVYYQADENHPVFHELRSMVAKGA